MVWPHAAKLSPQAEVVRDWLAGNPAIPIVPEVRNGVVEPFVFPKAANEIFVNQDVTKALLASSKRQWSRDAFRRP